MTGTNNPAYSADLPSKAGTIYSTAWLREKPAPLPTERVAIEEEIGNRQGKRTDLELRVERPEVKDKRPREVAAEKAGFGTVVAVVENHTPKSGMTFAVELNGVL